MPSSSIETFWFVKLSFTSLTPDDLRADNDCTNVGNAISINIEQRRLRKKSVTCALSALIIRKIAATITERDATAQAIGYITDLILN